MKEFQVEIFKTNVKNKKSAREVQRTLSVAMPDCQINFDLSDCDNVLRVEGALVFPVEVAHRVKQLGYECDILE
jgi:hypothetical protein